MKIDPEYLKHFLETCESFPSPVFTIHDLQEKGLDFKTDEFLFHISVLVDQGIIRKENGEPGFGFGRGANGHQIWAAAPLRLTAKGHEFIEALRNKEVWNTIKKDFKEASLNSLLSISRKLLEAYAAKKIDKILGD